MPNHVPNHVGCFIHANWLLFFTAPFSKWYLWNSFHSLVPTIIPSLTIIFRSQLGYILGVPFFAAYEPRSFLAKFCPWCCFTMFFLGRKKIIGMKSASTKQPGFLEVLALLPTFAALCNDEWWEVLQRFVWWFVDDFFQDFCQKQGFWIGSSYAHRNGVIRAKHQPNYTWFHLSSYALFPKLRVDVLITWSLNISLLNGYRISMTVSDRTNRKTRHLQKIEI